MNFRRCCMSCLLALVLIIPTATNATLVGLYADPYGGSCHLEDPGPGGVVTVYVILNYSVGATLISFAAPVPPESGLSVAGFESIYQTAGNLASGIQISLGPCQQGSAVLLTMYLVRTSAGSPCTPYAVKEGATAIDCSFVEQDLDRVGIMLNTQGVCSNIVPFQDELPADGATNVPLTTELSWDGGYFVCFRPVAKTDSSPVSRGTTRLYFGTSSSPPLLGSVASPYTVGPLTPETKYYWYLSDGEDYIFSPVWSFTTTTTVTTKPSTWGAIKALYR